MSFFECSASRRIHRAMAVLPLLALLPLLAAFTVPPNDGFVTDSANVLTQQQKSELDATLAAYRNETSNEIAILLVPSLGGEAIDEVGVQVGRAWGVGAKEKNNGILVLAALEERQVTIQTGYGLEGAVPDIVAKGIIDEDIVPRFRDGKYYEGLLAATESLRKHIGGEYTADRYAEGGMPDAAGFVFFLGFMVLNFLGAFLARSKSWWMGGVLGGVFGLILTVMFSWWLAIPGLILLGLIFDFIVSRMPRSRHGRGRWWGGGLGGGGFGGRGGGGFGGGSFGGGGASGRW
ncbi:MAG: TPM domain-containing protein [Candidatus Peribacteraceae bacterium]|nr:TPM domain-containing protein [Candidatus Peribacteraceae bacterium]